MAGRAGGGGDILGLSHPKKRQFSTTSSRERQEENGAPPKGLLLAIPSPAPKSARSSKPTTELGLVGCCSFYQAGD